MKGLGLVLILAGLVVLAMGIYGFMKLNSSEFSGELADWAIDTFNALGGRSALAADQSLQLGLVRNRILLTATGAACIILGVVLRKKQSA